MDGQGRLPKTDPRYPVYTAIRARLPDVTYAWMTGHGRQCAIRPSKTVITAAVMDARGIIAVPEMPLCA